MPLITSVPKKYDKTRNFSSGTVPQIHKALCAFLSPFPLCCSFRLGDCLYHSVLKVTNSFLHPLHFALIHYSFLFGLVFFWFQKFHLAHLYVFYFFPEIFFFFICFKGVQNCWLNNFRISTLKSWSDNSNVSVTLVLAYISCLSLSSLTSSWFLVITISGFGLKSGPYVYYIMRL